MSSNSKDGEQEVYALINNISSHRELKTVLSIANIAGTIGNMLSIGPKSIEYFKNILEDLLDQNSTAFKEVQRAIEEMNADNFLQEVGDCNGNSIGPVDANGSGISGSMNMASMLSGFLGIALSLVQKMVTQIAISNIPKQAIILPVSRDVKILKHSPLKKEQRNTPKEDFVWGVA